MESRSLKTRLNICALSVVPDKPAQNENEAHFIEVDRADHNQFWAIQSFSAIHTINRIVVKIWYDLIVWLRLFFEKALFMFFNNVLKCQMYMFMLLKVVYFADIP